MWFIFSLADQLTNIPPQNNNGSVSCTVILNVYVYVSRLLCFLYYFIYLGILHCFQHCTGHIMTGSWKGRGNQYIQFVRVLYCKLPTNGKKLPAFPLEAVLGIEPRTQRWEARV